ncbi:MAG: FAD:protein transferase [Nocardioidaceae bacterium]|jgi:thiamine biosynthesis lipoprotein|nr:FAD:protein transferase [Nocardioidaceae bacterium]
MGTVVTLDVRAPEPPAPLAAAVRAVTDRLRGIDDVFSPWREGSWVSRLITGRVLLADCPAEVRDVVELALRLAALTDGYFSPFWRGPSASAGPDPTGLVKGWAAQQASDVLLAHGLAHHVVNAAGDLVVSGRPDPQDATARWRVGISDPAAPGRLAGVVELPGGPRRWAVATSGPAELGLHVADPHTGRFPSSTASATVVAPVEGPQPEGGAFADACATALVAAGDTAGDLMRGLTSLGLEAFLMASDGSVDDPGRLLRR